LRRGATTSRLADEATGGQILIAQRLYADRGRGGRRAVDEFTLKGFQRQVAAFNVVGVREAVNPGATTAAARM
jgi:class 3 adenylate cyclase